MKHKETLPEQVQAFLQEQQMVQAGDTVCCALSGGADSVCLLRCLLELAEPLHLTITAVHVNHQLRGGFLRSSLHPLECSIAYGAV